MNIELLCAWHIMIDILDNYCIVDTYCINLYIYIFLHFCFLLLVGWNRSKYHLFSANCVNRLKLSEVVLFEVANILSERPIGCHPTHPSDRAYLCPNNILLGRATTRIPSGPFKEHKGNHQRFELIQSIANTFWKKMTKEFFPLLIVRQKWHVQKRNVTVGDVVVVQDSNTVQGEWRIACVSDVFPDDKNVVCNCEVQFKRKLPGNNFTTNFITLSRPVQRLIVLVPSQDDEGNASDSNPPNTD